MTTPQLTLQAMERLAFIRMLHQQGIAQSRLPEPLNFGCILTFHDAIELFLLLTAEHVGATVPDKGKFTDRFYNAINQALGAGKNLDARHAVGRITEDRNRFKHAHNWPSAQGIQQAREGTALFFQANTTKVFGIAYDEIDMADLITHQRARSLVKKANERESTGQRTAALAYLRHALAALLDRHQGKRGSLALGGEIPRPMRVDTVARLLNKGERTIYGGPGEKVAKQLDAVTDVTQTLQNAMRLLMLGVDLPQYNRFMMLTPYGSIADDTDELEHLAHPPQAATDEEFSFCQRFVISVALRFVEVETNLQPPSWEEGPGQL